MARINIEECWWADPRRDNLREYLKNSNQDQVAIRAWRLAQEFWAKGHLIPYEIFKYTEGAQALIESGLARIKEKDCTDREYIQAESKQSPSTLQGCFVYVGGSRDYLTWVRDQRSKGQEGGKKSARRPRDARGRLLKKPKQNPSRVQANSKGLQASYSVSVSDSVSDSDSSIYSGDPAEKTESQNKSPPGGSEAPEKDLTPVSRVWRSYKNAYESKYGADSATWNAKIGGQLSQFIQRVPAQEAPDIAAFYVNHPDAYFIRVGHSIGTLLQNAEKLRMEWLTGKQITGTQARQQEKHDANIQGVKAYLQEKRSGGAS